MQRKTLALMLGCVLALSSAAFLVTAESAAPDGTQTALQPRDDGTGFGPQWRMHRRDGERERGVARNPAVRSSLIDMRRIDRLYTQSGRAKDLPAFYQELLAKTQNPMLRNVIYLRLARLESAPSNTDKAIATLRQSLDENLKRADAQAAKNG